MVKHRACLSIGRLIVAVQAQSFVVIAGTVALSVCRWYVAVRCECWVVIVVERRARLSVSRSVDRRRTGTIIRSVDRRRISAISIVIAGIAALSVY